MSELKTKSKSRFGTRFFLRIVVALLALFGCYRMALDAGKSGVSRLLSVSGAVGSSLDVADVAIKLAPGDPQAHYARALVLINLQRLQEAVVELQLAIKLRPYHYYEWLDLGVTLDRLGDETGAETALRKSVELAPYFSQPRWQLGNLLFRQNRYDEAFAELRRGAETNSSLVSGLLEFAWAASDGDAQTMETLIEPRSTRRHLELATFLAQHRDGPAAVRHIVAAGEPRDAGEAALRNQTIVRLIAATLYVDAYAAWTAAHPAAGASPNGLNQLLNGDFVKPVARNEPGFSWQIGDVPSFKASIETAGPAAGANSLRLDFDGLSPPGNPLVYQLVLVQPNTRYSLNFVSKAESLATGGPPVVAVLDASNPAKSLGQSKALSPGTIEWSPYQVDFSTESGTKAVIFSAQRLACSDTLCPIVGKLWLSKFAISLNR
jgi:tetratricopeptide (TPR) repeat protein